MSLYENSQDRKFTYCPIRGINCQQDCAWRVAGKCCIASIPKLVDKLDEVITSINNIRNISR